MAAETGRIDLHLHTNISDGTDTPEELLENVRKAGLTVFSVTDHDSFKGAVSISALLREGDPGFRGEDRRLGDELPHDEPHA